MILGDTSRAHRLLHDKVGYSTVLTRADDDPTLNAGLVVFENFRGSGPV